MAWLIYLPPYVRKILSFNTLQITLIQVQLILFNFPPIKSQITLISLPFYNLMT